MKHPRLAICVCLAGGTFLLFRPSLDSNFISCDDPIYVTANPTVQRGLTLDGVRWAFSSLDVYWQPLTWLTHMADCQLYGLSPAGHHLTNVLLHTLNAVLLFLVLMRGTGQLWPSAFVAAAFAVHPLRVESVAWVAERKDVLSAACWLLAIWFYLAYSRRPKIGTYLPVLLFFALGVMAKPMVVTLPCTLLLLDFWPLGRLRRSHQPGELASRPVGGTRAETAVRPATIGRLVVEKAPLFAISVGVSFVTVWGQRACGALASLEAVSLAARALNALVSYADYLRMTLAPVRLGVLYPLPAGGVPVWRAVGAAVLLLFLTVGAFSQTRRRPYLLFGWLWYLGTLFPVIGLFQAGPQGLADRFTYVPHMGLFAALAWGAASLPWPARRRKALIAAAGAMLLIGSMARTRGQLTYWSDSVKLFEHTLSVSPDNPFAHMHLGTALMAEGRSDEAKDHYLETLRLEPSYADAHSNLASLLMREGRASAALSHFRAALALKGESPWNQMNLALALEETGRAEEAVRHYRRALELDPGHARTLTYLSRLLATHQDPEIQDAAAAIGLATRACELTARQDPECLEALAEAYASSGRYPEAAQAAREALALADQRGPSDLAERLARRLREILRGRPGDRSAP